jgi:DNA modification methylase
MNYENFLKTKKKSIISSGFDIDYKDINPMLFDFQKFTIKRAIKAGKYSVFADTGLGKTPMQLEIANLVKIKTQEPVLILAPLAVTGQTIKEGKKFHIDVHRLTDDTPAKGIYITNYEQLDNINCGQFGCIILDESSILKNAMGKYRNALIDNFRNTPYKFCFTATPSPNDPMELGNHAEFMDAISYNEMLAMYFVHDGGETQKWRLKGHAIDKFWEFVAGWAIMYNHPRDIGFDMDGFDLPPLRIIENQVNTKVPDGMLFGGLAVNATDYNASLRETEEDRIKETVKIVDNIGFKEPILIWTKQNNEAKQIYKQLTYLGHECRNVQGSDSPEKKESDLLGFSNGEYQILITKQEIASMGLNYQHCHYQIFNSVDFSFEKAYQGMRRSWRFGQKNEVEVHMITTDRMANVIKAQKKKQDQFNEMQKRMTKAVLKHINHDITTYQHIQSDVIENDYKLLQGDCVARSKELENNEADFIIFSPPFSELYTYSSHVEDMGNSKNYDEFAKHFKFLIPELSRVLKPGRICAVHCMDLPIQKGKEGYIGLRDFSGMLIDWFNSQGFIYHSRITIWKDPVIEMQRTKALGLLHKQLKKDSAMSRVGIPDYVLIFRNNGVNEIPIENIHIPVELWQKIASPIWLDIDYTNTLNYRQARGENDEKHIAPLQLDTIERLINLYTNEGETVFSPFGGIGSEGFQAIKMGRKSISIELKESYFDMNIKNHKNAVMNKNQIQLF